MPSTNPFATRTLTTATFPDEIVVGDKSKDWKISLLEERLESRITITQKLEADLAKRETMISELIIEKETAESAMDNLARKLTEAETLHKECFRLAIQHQNRAEAAEKEVLSLRNQITDLEHVSADLRQRLEAALVELADRDKTIASYTNERIAICEALNNRTREASERRDTIASLRSQIARATAIEAKAKELVDTWVQCGPKAPIFEKVLGELASELCYPHFAPAADAPSISPMGETSRRCDADDLATTAVDMDVAQRHGRVCRLHRAGKAVEEAYNGGGGMIKAMGDLIDTLAEFSPDELGQIPPETKADRLISELRGMVQRLRKENESLKGEVQTLRHRQAREDWMDGKHETTTINLNRLVEVKLTPTGQTSLAHYNAQAIVSFVSFQGVLRAHLRDVICIFGEALNRSHLAEPFEGNSITLLPEED